MVACKRRLDELTSNDARLRVLAWLSAACDERSRAYGAKVPNQPDPRQTTIPGAEPVGSPEPQPAEDWPANDPDGWNDRAHP